MTERHDRWWAELFTAAGMAIITIALALAVTSLTDAHLPDRHEHQVSDKSAHRTARVIHQTFGKKRRAHQAINVADCESDLRLHSSNGSHDGLFMLGDPEKTEYGWGPGRRQQIEAAHRLFHDRWWQPWQACRP